jgi:YD repeat-containing protein
MKTSRIFSSALFAVCMSSVPAVAQVAPLCGSDPTCTPDPGSSFYAGATAARAKMLNARGYSSPIVAKASVRTSTGATSSSVTVVGSQSYNYSIPILKMPGRAGMDLTLNLYYNSRLWDIDTANNTVTFNADRDFPSYGFRFDFGFIELSDFLILTESDGTKRVLMQGTAPSQPYMYYTTDGIHTQYNTSTGILTYRDGRTVQYLAFPSNASLLRPVWIKDANGNYFSISYVSGHDQLLHQISDSLGRVITFSYDSSNRLTSLTQFVHPSGTKTHATFTWGTPYTNGYSWYNFYGLTVNGAPTANQISVLTGCTYPNGTGYRFTYGDWGIINKIEQLSSTGSTRSSISYDYPLASAGAVSDAPTYLHETVSPDSTGSNTSEWTYGVTKNGTGVVTSMAITDPKGAVSTTNLDPNTGLISSVQIKDSSNTPQRTTAYTWTTTGFPPVSTVLDNIVTTLNDSGQQAKIAYGYDPWANVTDVYEYDFGLTLKRHTITTYGTTGDYVTRHIVNLPTQILIKDAPGNIVSRIDMAYDSTTLTSVMGAPDHDDISYGSGLITRGNLTSVARYSNAAAGAGVLMRNFHYDTVGNLVTAQLNCCKQEVFNFSSTTQYSAPDSIIRGPSGTQYVTSYTYNPDNNLLVTATDENGQTTSYQYDSINRVTQIVMPPQSGIQVQLNTSYGDDTGAPIVTNYNTANGTVTVTTLDGLGHVVQVDTKNGSTVVSSARYAYDKLWERTLTSNQFAPGDTQLSTTVTYDALGRVTQVTPPSSGRTQYQYYGNSVTITDPAGKQRKNYADALGRLIEVDEPGWGDALPGSASISISGSERSKITFIPPPKCPPRIICDPGPGETLTSYDSGTVTITVNGHADSCQYGQGDTVSAVVSKLVAAINGDTAAAVTATALNSAISLVARPPAAGAATNYSLSVSSLTANSAGFGSGTTSFPITAGQTLTGGEDTVNQNDAVLTATRRLITTYSYDALDNLISASEGALGPVAGQQLAGQLHSYSYDSLGRPTSASTPESGSVNAFYTDASNNDCSGDPSLPCRVQDARGVVKSLTYDALNRPVGVLYSDGTPGVTYTYDTGGAAAFALNRMTKIMEGSNSQTSTYDNLGRIVSVATVIDGTTYTTSYGYNLAGQITSITYPSGRVVAQSVDGIGRLSSVASGGTTYLNGFSYNAAGKTLGFTLGNGVQASFSYNDHLQLASLRYFKSGSATDVLNLGYAYGTNNNGQIQAVHYYTAPGTEDARGSEYFTYDPWSRLSAAQTGMVSASTPGTWSLQWGYDRFGNRLSQTLTGGNLSVSQPSFSIDPATNRVTNSGFQYDAAGNLISDGINIYTYGGANRLTQFNGTAATYTFFGPLRIKKKVGADTAVQERREPWHRARLTH